MNLLFLGFGMRDIFVIVLESFLVFLFYDVFYDLRVDIVESCCWWFSFVEGCGQGDGIMLMGIGNFYLLALLALTWCTIVIIVDG